MTSSGIGVVLKIGLRRMLQDKYASQVHEKRPVVNDSRSSSTTSTNGSGKEYDAPGLHVCGGDFVYDVD